jgi:probable F420-dependent oxidoreductase
MPKIRVGCTVHPQGGTYEQMRQAWREVEQIGADTLWTWDHFFPLYGDPNGPHFEGWTLLAAMAEVTERVQFGMLVTCNSYRNPNLLADMARTVDHISGGRHVLGIGSGWAQRDYDEYGYEFKTALERLEDLDRALPIIKSRLAKLNPGPVNGQIPIMIGGSGKKVTLRIVAEHADMWNTFGTPEEAADIGKVLDDWCTALGRDPSSIERSVLRSTPDVLENADAYVEAGFTHLIVGTGGPDFDLERLRQMVEWRDSRTGS